MTKEKYKIKFFQEGGWNDYSNMLFGQAGDFLNSLNFNQLSEKTIDNPVWNDSVMNPIINQLQNDEGWYRDGSKYKNRNTGEEVTGKEFRARAWRIWNQGNKDIQSFNEQLPVANALIPFMDIFAKSMENQSVRDKIAYRDINSYTVDGTRTPQGILQEGGIPVNPMGLYEENGPVEVPSRLLTFMGINTPTLVIPQKGKDSVVEVPLNIKKMNKNKTIGDLFRMLPQGIFSEGGSILSTVNTSIGDRMKVGNEDSYDIRNIIPLANLIPIQTELGEKILLPTGDVVQTNATKKHSKMKDDEVTDVVPEGSYIFSKFGSVKIKKKDAENVVVEEEDKPYVSGTKNSPPLQFKLSKYMDKKEMAPVDVVSNIERDFKITGREDLFSQVTDQENKVNRMPWLQSVIMLSEVGKFNKGIDNDISTQLGVYREGGTVMRKEYKVPQAQVGGAAAALPLLFNTIGDIFGFSPAAKARKTAEKLTNASISDVRANDKRQQELAGIGLGANLASILMQNPVVEYQDIIAPNVPTRVPFSYTDSFQNRIFANRPDTAGLTPAQAALVQDQYDAKALGTLSDLQYKLGTDSLNRKREANILQTDTLNKNIVGRTNAANLTNQNTNYLTTALGSGVAGYTTNLQNIGTNTLNALLSARGQQATNAINAGNQATQNLYYLSALMAQTLPSILDGGNNISPQDAYNRGYQASLGVTNQLPTLSSNGVQQSGVPCVPGYNC